MVWWDKIEWLVARSDGRESPVTVKTLQEYKNHNYWGNKIWMESITMFTIDHKKNKFLFSWPNRTVYLAAIIGIITGKKIQY